MSSQLLSVCEQMRQRCCLMLTALLDLSRVTSHASGLADISVMCSLGSEFGSTSSLAQEWRKLVDLCSDLQETDYDQPAASRFVIQRACQVVSCNRILYLLHCLIEIMNSCMLCASNALLHVL